PDFSKTPVVAHDDPFQDVQVVALRCAMTGAIYPLDTDSRWMLGGFEDCNLHVPNDRYISRLHCSLERTTDGRLIVRDRGSRNGTYIGCNRIDEAELRAGAYLSVGQTSLVALGSLPNPTPKASEVLLGHDPAFRFAIERALKAARADCNVLVVGETGTGKDVLARLIHESSRRAMHNFVPVNCGAIPRELIGSELFGHERGAFTGAVAERDGFFVEAHGGTLFLDEIGELPLEQQPHLLRALENRQIRRVGGQAMRAIDVRVIAATNRIDGLGTEGSHLRLDLYHRIACVIVQMPPLRERIGDLAELVHAQLAALAPQFGAFTLTADAWTALANYDWPGNVRELIHTIRRGVTMASHGTITTDDVFPDVHAVPRTKLFPRAPEGESFSQVDRTLRGLMEHALMQKGSIRAAAKSIGMAKSTFAEKAKAWGLMKVRKDT
ncbi:MAG: sigma 54-interacting transcriptional regulator, partial [Proteobacteria bacterium]|nr:sigma 54-interacting transcriptional regulator [Pseudomonadota bacterium]